METPLYQWVAHLGMYVFGEDPAVARVTAWLILLCGVVAAFRMMRAVGGSSLAVGLVAMLFFSPMFLFEGRQVQPDGPALGLGLVAAAAFYRYSTHERRRTFVLGLLAYTAAVLIRPTWLFAGPAMWLLTFSARPVSWKSWMLRGAWFAIPLGCFLGWNAWAEHLNATFDAGRTYFGRRFDWQEVRKNLTNWPMVKFVFGFLVPNYLVNWALFPAVVLGAALSLGKEYRRLSLSLWAWLLGGIVLCFMYSFRIRFHWYYPTMMVPPPAYFGALGWLELVKLTRPGAQPGWGRRWMAFALLAAWAAAPLVGGAWDGGAKAIGASGPLPGKGWSSELGGWTALGLALLAVLFAKATNRWRPRLALVLLAVGLVGALSRGGYDLVHTFSWRARLREWGSFDRNWAAMRAAVDCYVPREERILAVGGSPWLLYLARRRGFSEPAATVEQRRRGYYRRRGARVLLHFRGVDRAPKRVALGDPLDQAPHWGLYCIAPEGCRPRPGCANR